MLIIGKELLGAPVMSLQTGTELAKTTKAIIDPADLSIKAYVVSGQLLETTPCYLRTQEVREYSEIGFIVDSAENFTLPGDVINLDKVISYHFEPIGMTVRSEKGDKLGHIIDYNLDLDTFTIIQLVVKRPLLKSFSDTEIIIHRSQIVEINDKNIVIKEHADIPEHNRITTPGAYINPFRANAAGTAETSNRN